VSYYGHMAACRIRYAHLMLRRHSGCVARAATDAGLHRSDFYNLLRPAHRYFRLHTRRPGYFEHMAACSRRYLKRTLRRNGDCVEKAAKAAGLNRTHLYRLLEQADIHRRRRGNAEWQALAQFRQLQALQ
jgi:DNA-binding phage protein